MRRLQLVFPLAFLLWGPTTGTAGFFACATRDAATTPAAPPAGPCSDPCLQAAKSAFHACTSGASTAFLGAIASCVQRDHECAQACRFTHQECRDGTGVDETLAACRLRQAEDEARCRDRFPPGSLRRNACLFRAEVAGFRCGVDVRRHHRRAMRECRAGFVQCVGACAPGAPPEGVGPCRAAGRKAFKAEIAGCKVAYEVTASGCIDKDLTCVQGCGDGRTACAAPTQDALAAAVQACMAQGKADVAACQPANPGGGAALQQCVTAAQASASACVDAAGQAAAPGLAACEKPYLRCVRGCPPA